MSLVFQYGSNCNAARLNDAERLAGAAIERGRAETIDEYDIVFDVWSQKNGCAASDLILMPGTGRHAWGALYDVPDDRLRGNRADGVKTLEQIEGPRYQERTIRVRDPENKEIEAVTFLVRPADRRSNLWTSVDYVRHIVKGLRLNDAPEEYVQHVIDVAIETNRQSATAAEEQTRLIVGLRATDFSQ